MGGVSWIVFATLKEPVEPVVRTQRCWRPLPAFEALKHPTSQDLQQFSNLFAGLFELTREDTRRTAVAALSRIRHLPADVAMMVADQPIRISAPFLALSPCLGRPTAFADAGAQRDGACAGDFPA